MPQIQDIRLQARQQRLLARIFVVAPLLPFSAVQQQAEKSRPRFPREASNGCPVSKYGLAGNASCICRRSRCRLLACSFSETMSAQNSRLGFIRNR